MGNENFWDDTTQHQGALKAGFLGFNGSGKTMTAVLLACAAREILGLKGPVGFYDTETGELYVRDVIRALTGQEPLVKRSRSFDMLLRWGKMLQESGASVGIADSITHPWRELCDSYLNQLNDERRKKNWREQKKLEFQDWNIIKPRWEQWTRFYLDSPVSLIIAGRAGWEYEMEMNDETKKRELVKTGVKMKTEGEFGFEPSLLVQMEMEQKMEPGLAIEIVRRATVLKDRFSIIDGATIDFKSRQLPKETKAYKDALGEMYKDVRAFFLPHLERLKPGQHVTIGDEKTDFGLNEEGRDAWEEEKRQRTILCEEIQAELVSAIPGQKAEDKKLKADLLKEVFQTGSWTKVEGMKSGALREGLAKLREKLHPPKAEEKPSEPPSNGQTEEPKGEQSSAGGAE